MAATPTHPLTRTYRPHSAATFSDMFENFDKNAFELKLLRGKTELTNLRLRKRFLRKMLFGWVSFPHCARHGTVRLQLPKALHWPKSWTISKTQPIRNELLWS